MDWHEGPSAKILPQFGPDLNDGVWDSKVSNVRKTVVVGDGNFIVDFKLPSGKAVTRNVTRLKFSQVDEKVTTSYRASIANNRKNKGGEWAIGKAQRPRVEAQRATDEDPVEMAMIVPDDGMVVVAGTAPLVAVKRATVSSVGTTYAIESMTGNGFLIKVLDSSTTHPVKVFFPGTGDPAGLVIPNGSCWHFFENAYNENDHEDGENIDCDELTAYAEAFLLNM